MTVYFFLGDISSRGGIERVTVTLANALSKIYPVCVISLYKSNADISFTLNKSVELKILNDGPEKSMYNRTGGVKAFLFDFWYMLKKNQQLMKLKYITKNDVLISCDIKMSMLLGLFCSFRKTKIVAIEHFEHDVGNTILKKIRKLLYPHLYSVVSLTPEDKTKYLTWLPENKHWVIPNILQDTPKNKLSEYYSREKIVLAVGRLSHQKGFDLLIKAWSKVDTQDWVLEIVGDGEERNSLTELITSLNLETVRIIPFQKNIEAFYERSQLFVLSSRYEGLGMVLLEALSYGLPCISFDCPAGPKTILSEGNGILVPTGDVNLLSDSITKMIKDSSQRLDYHNKSTITLCNYSETTVITKWRHLLNGI